MEAALCQRRGKHVPRLRYKKIKKLKIQPTAHSRRMETNEQIPLCRIRQDSENEKICCSSESVEWAYNELV